MLEDWIHWNVPTSIACRLQSYSLIKGLLSKYAKLIILGREQVFSSQTGKILKVSCYWNYSILTKFGTTIQTIKWSSWVGGWPEQAPNKSKMMAVKSPYLCDRSTDFDEIWRDDAYWPLAADQPLKFWIFENPWWRRPPSWKITKIAISLQLFDRSLRNLVWWCMLVPCAWRKVQFFNFRQY